MSSRVISKPFKVSVHPPITSPISTYVAPDNTSRHVIPQVSNPAPLPNHTPCTTARPGL